MPSECAWRRHSRTVRASSSGRSSTAGSPTTRSTSPLPGDEIAVGQLHPTDPGPAAVEDMFLGLGYEIRYDREVETVEYNFDKLAFEPTHPSRSPRATFFLDDDTVLRTETSPSPDPLDGGEAAADLHGLHRPLLPPGRDRCDALPDLPPVRGARRRSRTDARRPEGHADARDARALRRGPARPVPHPLLPVHGAVGRARRVVRRLRRRRLPRPASTPVGSRWAAPAWSTRACSRTWGSIRRSGVDSHSASGSSASRSSVTASPRSARSGHPIFVP